MYNLHFNNDKHKSRINVELKNGFSELYSDYNGSAIQEFPYCMATTHIAIDIIIHFAVMLPSTLFWNLTVFTALIKSKLSNKPLTVLYSSLLLVLCMDKIAQAIATATISPDILRFCICDITSSFSILSLHSPLLFCTANHLPEGRNNGTCSYGRIIPSLHRNM